MDWNDLKYFLAVARCRSLTEASRHLRVSQSTIARRITALENSVSSELFIKRKEGYSLSIAGQTFLERAEAAESQLLSLERNGASPLDEYRGTIRIAAPELLGQHFIIPELFQFINRFPDIKTEIIADVRPLNLAKREADIVVRLVHPSHGDYVMRRAGSLAMGVYASPDYVKIHGLPERQGSLAVHRLIGWDQNLDYFPFSRWFFDTVPDANIVLRTHTMSAQLAAVQAGLGLAVLPAVVGTKMRLIRTLTSESAFHSEIWLLQASDTKRIARVNALSDYLANLFESNSKILSEFCD